MYLDRHGLLLTATSEAAVSSYREGVDLLLSAWSGAAEALDRALTEDADFALANIARARLHQIHGQAADARSKAAHARTLADHVSKRERQHIEIVDIANQFELTAISLPMPGLTLPAGLMLMARGGDDRRLLAIATGVEADLTRPQR
jgi:hypothetical protein